MVYSVITNEEEKLISNVFPIIHIPKLVRHFKLSNPISHSESSYFREYWAFRNLENKGALAFTKPPESIAQHAKIEEVKRIKWQHGSKVEGILAEHLISELLAKSIDIHCRIKGLMREPKGHGYYFPLAFLPKNKMLFTGYLGKKNSVLVCGQRRFGDSIFRYHLAPCFRIRYDLFSGFIAQLLLRIHITDTMGNSLERRSIVARRKRIGRSWWNKEWLNRQLAVMSFLSNEQNEIIIGEDPDDQVVVKSIPLEGSVSRGINENILKTIGAQQGLMKSVEQSDGAEDM